jgi:hypothetical protein
MRSRRPPQEAIEAFALGRTAARCKPEDGLKNVFVEGTVRPSVRLTPKEKTMARKSWMYSVSGRAIRDASGQEHDLDLEPARRSHRRRASR